MRMGADKFRKFPLLLRGWDLEKPEIKVYRNGPYECLNYTCASYLKLKTIAWLASAVDGLNLRRKLNSAHNIRADGPESRTFSFYKCKRYDEALLRNHQLLFRNFRQNRYFRKFAIEREIQPYSI